MKIEEGKFYKTRDGRKVGPMHDFGHKDGYPWSNEGLNGYYYSDDGTAQGHEYIRDNDLISEWPSANEQGPGPIREIRKREIVEGEYGPLCICPHERGAVLVGIKSSGDQQFTSLNAEQLREAAHLFNKLAEFLEGEGSDGQE